MARFWIGAVLFTFIINEVTSSFNDQICTVVTENIGLIPPLLPTNFALKGERINQKLNETQYEEMYFDFSNSRAKYVVQLRGREYHALFDYQTLQVVKYQRRHPGSALKYDPESFSCKAINMEDDKEVNDLFGFQDLAKPRMYTSDQVLRFGGPYQYAFVSNEILPDRGVNVNNFYACIYDKTVDATIKANYSFTGFKVAPAGGTLEKVVSGVEGRGLLSVPVTMRMEGVETDETGDEQPFDETISVSWFEGEPIFKQGTFQIPPLLYCDQYRGRKDKKDFPDAFSTRIQRSSFAIDSYGNLTANETTTFEQIHYYLEKKLARRDYTPTKGDKSKAFENFQSLDTIKTVWDFNEGLVYTTHKPTGKCFIEPIKPKTFFDKSVGDLFIKMASPEQVFEMESNNTEYKGTDFVRDVECDVWTGKQFDTENNVTLIKETYWSTNGWHEEVEELVRYGTPLQHAVVTADYVSACCFLSSASESLEDRMQSTSCRLSIAASAGEKVQGIDMISFLKFKAKPPRLMLFDISNCIEMEEHQHLAIDLSLSDENKKLLFDYKFQFLETAQYYLTGVSQVVTPLRVQKLQLRRLSKENPKIFLVFILVGKINLKDNLVVGQSGASLQEAIHNLQRLIDQYGFAIQFVHPSSEEGKVTETTLITAEPSSLYNLTSDGTLQGPIKIKEPEKTHEQLLNVYVNPTVLFDDDDAYEDEDVTWVRGMKPGGLAALSISMLFIGVGIGIAVMYLYLRKFGPGTVQDRITMTTRPTTSI
ncbi:uncharacterized protein LOC129228709 [Uloborus diversus]|uniref:uncharacterized protein LOC129228709 n=1 Tax=Uloborus diversus TaxID=327109 RepID=UPI00240A8B5D|nr:uncharacterized protein LOC129228709 [Uloborus diversus]